MEEGEGGWGPGEATSTTTQRCKTSSHDSKYGKLSGQLICNQPQRWAEECNGHHGYFQEESTIGFGEAGEAHVRFTRMVVGIKWLREILECVEHGASTADKYIKASRLPR